jgi:hypothetical protein
MKIIHNLYISIFKNGQLEGKNIYKTTSHEEFVHLRYRGLTSMGKP